MRPTTIGIAISIPEPWRAWLDAARFRAGDPAAGTVPAHLTLLGPTELSDAQRIEAGPHLAEVAARHRPFSLVLRGTGTFRPVTEVVFVAVVQGGAECARLAEGLRTGPLERELAFPYHPHVTVAHDVPAERLDRIAAELADFTATIEVDRFHLYEVRADDNWYPVADFVLGMRSDQPR